MSIRVTLAVARRVLTQLRHDHRSLAMLLALPCVVLALLWWMFRDTAAADGRFAVLAPALLAVIPFVVMFLVTSVTTLRERTSGTLERLLSMPMGRLDLLLGYAVAFGLLACLQSGLAVALCVGPLGLAVDGPVWALVVVALANAVLGTALGLFVSAFARTEFQAVQFMPVLVVPQILLCGLFLARDQMPTVLHALSDVLPLSYAVDAMTAVSSAMAPSGDGLAGVSAATWADLGVVLGFTVAALALGAATLRRRTA